MGRGGEVYGREDEVGWVGGRKFSVGRRKLGGGRRMLREGKRQFMGSRR